MGHASTSHRGRAAKAPISLLLLRRHLSDGGLCCLLLLRLPSLQKPRFLLARLLLLQQGLRLLHVALTLVDRLNKDTFVLVHVTLRVPVKEMVEMLVDLLLLPVLPQKAIRLLHVALTLVNR